MTFEEWFEWHDGSSPIDPEKVPDIREERKALQARLRAVDFALDQYDLRTRRYAAAQAAWYAKKCPK